MRLFAVLLSLTLGSLACSLGGSATPSSLLVTPVPTDTQAAATRSSSTASPIELPPTSIQSQVSPVPLGPTLAPPSALDRLKVVYTKAGDLWLWTPSDGFQQLTQFGSASGRPPHAPRLSSDGQVIAFLRPLDDYHIELWGIDTNGANLRRLVGLEDLDTIGGGVRDPNAVAINPFHFEWLPGVKTLAFNTYQVFIGPGLSLLDDLNLVDANSSEVSFLLLAGWGGEFTYSPDGSQVAIVTPTQIILSEADGGNYRPVLSYETVNTYSDYRFYAKPVWSPDGTFLRVALPPVDPLAQPPQATELWRIPVDGSPPYLEGSLVAVPFFDTPISYSPDLSHLAYIQPVGDPSENTRQLMIADADGANVQSYHQAPLLHFETWGVNSQSFAFFFGEDQQMYLGQVDVPPSMVSSGAPGVMRLRWVDSDYYIYLQINGGGFDILLGAACCQPLLIDTVPGQLPEYDFMLLPSSGP